jgi:hypothetical protein
VNENDIRDFILRVTDAEAKKVTFTRDDIDYLAKLSSDEYEKLKLHFYMHAFLNEYKIIAEQKLDQLVQMAIAAQVEKLTATTLADNPNLLVPAGFKVDSEALSYTKDGEHEEIIAQPAFYISQFYYYETSNQRLYIIKTLHNPPREIEARPDEKLAKKLANAGVMIFDKKLTEKYIRDYLKLNTDYLTREEVIVSGDYLVDLVREFVLRNPNQIQRVTLREGGTGIALWKSDVERIAKRAKVSYRKFLVLLEREGVLIPAPSGERERVVYVNKTERARKPVLDEKALLRNVEENKVMPMNAKERKEQAAG